MLVDGSIVPDYSYEDDIRFSVVGSGNLVIRDISADDSDVYSCEFQNGTSGHITALTASLRVNGLECSVMYVDLF